MNYQKLNSREQKTDSVSSLMSGLDKADRYVYHNKNFKQALISYVSHYSRNTTELF